MLIAAHVLGTFVSLLSLEESRSDYESFLGAGSDSNTRFRVPLCRTTGKYAWINEGSKATLATHRTTHQGPRQRTRVVDLFGQHVQACTCMDVQESQSNWPKMRKNLGKTGVLQHGLQKANGEDRNRTTYEFLGKLSL